MFLGSKLLGGGDGDAGSSTSPAFPDAPEEEWSVRTDGYGVRASANGSSVFVTAFDDSDDDFVVTALDVGEGDELWSTTVGREVPNAGVDIVTDDVILVYTCFDERCTTYALDAETGDELWDDELDGTFSQQAGALFYQEENRLSTIDATTGDTLESVRADSISIDSNGFVTGDDGDEIEVYRASSLETVFGPVDVDDDTVAHAYDGKLLVTAIEDELVSLDGDGEVVRESRVDADVIYGIRYVGGDVFVLSTDEGILGVRPEDGSADEIWSEDGDLVGVLSTNSGFVALINDDSELGVFDARTGDRILSLDDYYDNVQLFAANGIADGLYSDGEWDGTAYGFSDGEEMWELETDGRPRLVPGAIVSVSEDGDVTYYR